MKEKQKYITTHEQLLECNGRKVSCKIDGEFIEDAKINVHDKNTIYICSKEGCLTVGNVDYMGYEGIICLHSFTNSYERYSRNVTEIQLLELLEPIERKIIFGAENLGNVVLIQKDQDTDKVIRVDGENFPLIKAFLENDNKEGSRLWAVEQAFNGEEIRINSWENKNVRIGWKKDKGFTMYGKCGSERYTGFFSQKDGWELYKEKPVEQETMTLEELIKSNHINREFRFIEGDSTLYMLTETGIKFGYQGKWYYRTIEEVVLSLKDPIKLEERI